MDDYSYEVALSEPNGQRITEILERQCSDLVKVRELLKIIFESENNQIM